MDSGFHKEDESGVPKQSKQINTWYRKVNNIEQDIQHISQARSDKLREYQTLADTNRKEQLVQIQKLYPSNEFKLSKEARNRETFESPFCAPQEIQPLDDLTSSLDSSFMELPKPVITRTSILAEKQTTPQHLTLDEDTDILSVGSQDSARSEDSSSS